MSPSRQNPACERAGALSRARSCLGGVKDFQKNFGRPIELMRDIGATDKQQTKGKEASDTFNAHVKEIMLRAPPPTDL